MTKIYQYLHYPNATELGQGNTHETYLMIEKKFDLSKIFPAGITVKVTDLSSGKKYALKSAVGSEFRVNQFGPIYRDYDTHEGDEIWLTAIEADDNIQVYLRVEQKNRITLSFTNQGAFFNNDDRIAAYGSKQSGYTIPSTFNGNAGNLTIKYVGAKKKRSDSPDLTDFYEVEFAGTSIKNGNYILDLDTKEFYPFQKATLNVVSLSGEQIPEDANSSAGNGGVDADTLDKYVKLLQENHNLILTGAPGTGKTHLAKQIAAAMIANCAWNKLSSEQLEQVQFVQFHPSYDYTDFVEGLRPVEGGDFERKDGIFKEFCKKAIRTSPDSNEALKYFKEDVKAAGSLSIPYYDRSGVFTVSLGDKGNIIVTPKSEIGSPQSATDEKIIESIEANERIDKNSYTYYIGIYLQRHYMVETFVFIVDEINRGELSKIFGELFYSIEPNYRGIEGRVKTQYNEMVKDGDLFKEGFYVPENVYIIGTMNDVDRSVESMDFAIRRRFAWKEVTADESAENMGISGLALAKMNALNKALIECDLTEAYCIGGAYFLKVKDDDFKALWDLRLKGVVSEYFRGDPDASRKLKKVEDSYFAASLTAPVDPQSQIATPDSDSPTAEE